MDLFDFEYNDCLITIRLTPYGYDIENIKASTEGVIYFLDKICFSELERKAFYQAIEEEIKKHE